MSDSLAKIQASLEGKAGSAEKPVTTWGKVKKVLRKAALPLAAVGLIASPFVYSLAKESIVVREKNAVRNCLVSGSNVTYIAGNKEKKAANRSDFRSENKFYEGGGIESKIGTKLAESVRETRGEIESYTMYDTQNMRIATSTRAPEIFQAGMRIAGTTNYSEKFAEIVLPSKSKSSTKYMVYKVDKQRTWEQNDIDVVEFPVERGLRANEPGVIESIVDSEGNPKNDLRVMVNRLVETRNSLGWIYGRMYRDGTILQDFACTPENKKLAEEFFKTVRTLDRKESENESKREELIAKLLETERKMQRTPIYTTTEDGFFKILPQESTIYLGENPSTWTKFINWFGLGMNSRNRLRVENQWDLFPGDIPLLNQISIGQGKNKNHIFDKYNNGGYTIEDKFGELARIKIEDFWLHYGQDVIYHYYLDLNGDGNIDEDKEEIGKVLCRTTHDEKTEIEKMADGVLPDSDLTLTTNYYFMAPDEDIKKGWDYFKLCAYMETMMPDQVHRGFGQHSLLGFINDQRSDIMLFKNLNIENLSRALTQESTLVAKYDNVNLLIAAKRPYAEELAKQYGIDSEFQGKYQTSELTSERTILPWPLINLGLFAGSLAGGYYYLRHRRRMKQEAISKLKIEYKTK